MSWYLVDRVGRRDLTFYGLLALTVMLLLTGGLATAASPGAVKGTVALILLYCWWYNVTIGATAYTVLCEVSTARLRIKTIAIGFVSQNALNLVWNFVLPYLFNPDKADLGAKVAFIFGGLRRAVPGLSVALLARDGWPHLRGARRDVHQGLARRANLRRTSPKPTFAARPLSWPWRRVSWWKAEALIPSKGPCKVKMEAALLTLRLLTAVQHCMGITLPIVA